MEEGLGSTRLYNIPAFAVGFVVVGYPCCDGWVWGWEIGVTVGWGIVECVGGWYYGGWGLGVSLSCWVVCRYAGVSLWAGLLKVGVWSGGVPSVGRLGGGW